MVVGGLINYNMYIIITERKSCDENFRQNAIYLMKEKKILYFMLLTHGYMAKSFCTPVAKFAYSGVISKNCTGFQKTSFARFSVEMDPGVMHVSKRFLA